MTEFLSAAIGALLGALFSYFAHSISEKRQKIITLACEIIDGVAASKFNGNNAIFAAASAKSRLLFSNDTVAIVEKMRVNFDDKIEMEFAIAVKKECKIKRLIF